MIIIDDIRGACRYMRLFRGAGRKAGRVAKNVARNMIMPQDAADSKKKASKPEAAAAPQHTDEEYEALKEKYEAVMRSKWEEYYKSSCDGECESCEYYDWCPDDFVDEDLVDEGAQDKEAQLADDDAQDAEPPEQKSEEDSAKEPAEDSEEESPEDEVELTEEELAAKEAAEAYYEAGCDGECESCEYYDWCPDDFVDEDLVDEGAQDKEAQLADDDAQDVEALEQKSEEDSTEEPAEDSEEESPEDEVELTEEELAAKEAAEAYYEAGCDGECESCEYYDWCPAELEGDPDDEVLFKGVTQGDVKNVAKEGVNLAREGALVAKELKEAMDDIFGGLDLKNLTK